MKKIKAYFSVPVRMDWYKDVEPFVKAFSNVLDITYWQRNGGYQVKHLLDADAVVFFLPDLKWEMEISELPSGLRKELHLAQINSKQIFIAYKRKTSFGQRVIYGAKVSKVKISGDSSITITPEEYSIERNKSIFDCRDNHSFDTMKYGSWVHESVFRDPVYEETPLGVLVREGKHHFAFDIETSSLHDKLSKQLISKLVKSNEASKVIVAHGAYL